MLVGQIKEEPARGNTKSQGPKVPQEGQRSHSVGRGIVCGVERILTTEGLIHQGSISQLQWQHP